MTTLVPTVESDSTPSIFEDFFNDGFLDMPQSFAFTNQKGAFMPNVNFIESTDNFEIELAAPGLQNKDFKVEVKNGVLTISAQKKEENKNFRKREFSSFRSFILKDSVAADKIDTNYKNGILKLTLPKKNSSPKTSTKQIKIG